MAGNAVIGALRVVLGADSAALEKGLKDARGSLSGFAADVLKIGSGISLEKIFEGIAHQIGESIKQAVEFGDQLNKASQKYGMPVEQLSKLKYAADLADVSFESLSKGLAKFNRGIVDAGRGQGQALEAFAAMGINIRDSSGALKDSNTLLQEAAAKFATYKDGAEKTALAIALFGRAGAEMIPLLNLGRDGLEAAGKEAEKFGLVMGQDAAKKAEEFNDNLKRLSAIWRGVFIQVMGDSIDVVKQVSGVLVQLGKDSDLRQQITDGVVSVISNAVKILYTLLTVIQRVGIEWNAFKRIFTATTLDDMSAAWSDFVKEGDNTKEILGGLSGKLDDFMKHAADAGESVSHIADKAAPALGNVGNGLKKLQGFLDGIIKQTAALQAQGDTIGKTAYETDRLRIINEALAVAGTKNISVNSQLYASIVKVADAHAAANEKAQLGKAVYDETRTSFETFTARVNELSAAFDRGDLSADLFTRGIVVAQQKLVQSDPYISAFGNSLTTAFDSAIDGGKKFSDILNQLLKDLAKALANAAFKQLLFGGQGGSSPGILTSLFGGFKLPGFATGGSFQVGGSGGVDSQLVAFHASPNEQVTVGKGDTMGGGGQLTVAISLDNELLRAVVQDESGRVVASATPRIVDIATSKAVSVVPAARRNNPSYFG